MQGILQKIIKIFVWATSDSLHFLVRNFMNWKDQNQLKHNYMKHCISKHFFLILNLHFNLIFSFAASTLHKGKKFVSTKASTSKAIKWFVKNFRVNTSSCPSSYRNTAKKDDKLKFYSYAWSFNLLIKEFIWSTLSAEWEARKAQVDTEHVSNVVRFWDIKRDKRGKKWWNRKALFVKRYESRFPAFAISFK